MSDETPRDPRDRADSSEPDTHDTQAILARRRRFIAAALGSLTIAASAGCAPPQPCLEYVDPDRPDNDASDSSSGGDTMSADSQPQPCLSPVLDSGVMDEDASPQPCLTAPQDSGSSD